LSKYNDYVFLMAYDQYSDNSGPGPIAHQKWIEGAVDAAVKTGSRTKADPLPGSLWLRLATGQGDVQPYSELPAGPLHAKDNEAIIDFDNDSYNLHYDYDDENNVRHQVQFTDAATIFNALRFATEYGLAGTSILAIGG